MSLQVSSAPQNNTSLYKKVLAWIKKPLVVFSAGSLMIIAFIIWVAHFPGMISNSPYYKIYRETGQIGDTLGGIMGPPIAIIGAVLTFLAFYIQYQANIDQRKQFAASMSQQNKHFEDTIAQQQSQFGETIKLQTQESTRQANAQQLEQIESRFFELLRIHKENVNEISLGKDISGRRSFEYMFGELRWIYFVVKYSIENYVEHVNNLPKVRDIDPLKFAYTLFFNGSDMLKSSHYRRNFTEEEDELFIYCLPDFEEAQRAVDRFIKAYPGVPTKVMLNETHNGSVDNLTGEFYYHPVIGHANQLGHLYRHLYQTCQFIIKQNVLDFPQKKEYIRTLRAQLSNYEQIMLYYNALAWFENEWHHLFVDYQFIHNIPIGTLDFGADIEELYEEEIAEVWNKYELYMFEHQKYRPSPTQS